VIATLEYDNLTGEQPATDLLAGYGHAMRALAGWFSTTQLPRRSLWKLKAREDAGKGHQMVVCSHHNSTGQFGLLTILERVTAP
jgi:hypothetical protein